MLEVIFSSISLDQTLLGFLPKGIMRDTGDVNRLGPEFSDKYKVGINIVKKYKLSIKTQSCKLPVCNG